MKKISVIFLIILISFGCKTKEQIRKEIQAEYIKYNRFDDEYINFKYLNYNLGLILEFDGDWTVYAKYENFDDFQKSYARSFYSQNGEVLFVGNNEQKKIGIRCTCEKLGLENEEYFEEIKNLTSEEIKKYNIEFIEDGKETELKNIKAIKSIFTTTINPNNAFTFISVIFKKDRYNYKIDIWTYNSDYENESKYMNDILNTIDFLTEDMLIDNTTDIK